MVNKKMLKKLIPFLLVLVVVFAATGSTLAYLATSSTAVENIFTPAKPDVEIDEKFNDNVKSSIKVDNIGDIPVYIRVKLVFNWRMGENPYGKAPWGDNSIVNYDTTKWKLGIDGYFYHLAPVAVNGETAELLKESITLKEEGGLSQSLEVMASCVQAEPDDAVLDLWGTSTGGSVTTVNAQTGALTVQ